MKLRRFRATFLYGGNETAIGITEHGDKWDNATIAIHSLYDNKRVSRRDVSVDIFKHIINSLEVGEIALLQMNLYSSRKLWQEPFKNRLRVQYTSRARGQYYQTELLCSDAMKRKTDISEVFDEPVQFNAVQQEKEEKGEDGN